MIERKNVKNTMGYKVWINYILVRMKIRNILPAYYINKVKIEECGEELVKIDDNKDIMIADRMEKPVYLRKTVYHKLQAFIEEVKKDGYTIKLYDAYRTLEEQKRSWEERLKQTREEFPEYTEEEVIGATSLKVAKVEDTNNVGGHQTGAAIDITLIRDGIEIDMGTQYEEYNQKTITKNNLLTKEQQKNRKYMKKKLEKLGFSNFPAEWWHYSYGDRMWAAYKGKKTCFYGYIEK